MYLYVLYNKEADKFYIGTTDDINRRIQEHNTNTTHFTGRLPGSWEQVFIRWFYNSSEAICEEKRLKRTRNRQYLKWYIANQDPVAQRIEQLPSKK